MFVNTIFLPKVTDRQQSFDRKDFIHHLKIEIVFNTIFLR